MNAEAYPYAQGDRLAQPCSYMYTPYQGPALPAAYLASRQASLETLGQALAQADPLSPEEAQLLARGLALWQQAYPGQAPPPLLARLGGAAASLDLEAGAGAAAQDLAARGLEQAQETGLLLQGLLALAGLGPLPLAAADWLERLLGRFETSKRLYHAYQPGFRQGQGGHQELAPYAGLALALGWVNPKGQDLRRLNAALKLGDLLGSQAAPLAGQAEARARAWLALVWELTAVKELMARLGVPA